MKLALIAFLCLLTLTLAGVVRIRSNGKTYRFYKSFQISYIPKQQRPTRVTSLDIIKAWQNKARCSMYQPQLICGYQTFRINMENSYEWWQLQNDIKKYGWLLSFYDMVQKATPNYGKFRPFLLDCFRQQRFVTPLLFPEQFRGFKKTTRIQQYALQRCLLSSGSSQCEGQIGPIWVEVGNFGFGTQSAQFTAFVHSQGVHCNRNQSPFLY